MVSVIIPIRPVNDQTWELTSQCVQSLVGYDELILQFDLQGEGFAKTVNKGVARAKGEWIAIVNNDTKMLNGSIKDMCKFQSVVRPKLVGGELAKFAFVVMPHKIWEAIGGLSEDYELGFYEDDEFLRKVQDKNFYMIESPLTVWHYGGATIQHFSTPEQVAHNKSVYESKFNTDHE